MPCDRAPKSSLSREPQLFTQAGAAPTRRNGLACFGPTGVQEQGAGTRGSLGNLTDPAASIDMPAADPADQLREDPQLRSRAGGDEAGRTDGIAKRRQRSAARR